jgi:hypothetical protein
MAHGIKARIGKCLARFLDQKIKAYTRWDVNRPSLYADVLLPGDLILVEGDKRISSIIKYLTQSTWSHVAMFVGGDGDVLVEADLDEGVLRVPLSKYDHYNVRILRPVGLSEEERLAVCTYMTDRIGYQYDLKHITDLLRYFLPLPRFGTKNSRKYLVLGSSDPTRGICSSLVAQAFQSIDYPILPLRGNQCYVDAKGAVDELAVCKREETLFVPRDFDLSPYFAVVKPTLERFNHHDLKWVDEDTVA